MSQRLLIDCLAFAREAGSLKGELPIANLTRTLEMLADSAGILRYTVEGRMGERNRPQLFLQIESELTLCCQRCLEGIKYSLKIANLLEFVSEEELTQDEIEDDSRDFLPAQTEVDVLTLIEDEIILDLPPAPRHESCVLPDSGQQTESISPFSVLGGLKGRA